MPDPKNTGYDQQKTTPNIRGTMDSHKRLFGTGAKLSAPTRIIAQWDKSFDEQAWDARPKSESKDINLPAARKPAAKPTTTKRPATKKLTR